MYQAAPGTEMAAAVRSEAARVRLMRIEFSLTLDSTVAIAPGIAQAFDRDDNSRSRRVELDLLAQVGHGHVHRAGLQLAGHAPDVLQKFLARHGPRAVAVQPAQ